MNSKITIAIIISVVVTAGIIYSTGFEQSQISQVSEPEIVYVNNTVSEYFGAHKILKKLHHKKS